MSGRNLKKGRALLRVTVTGRGVVVVFGKKAGQAKTLTFPIVAKGKAARTLNQKDKVKVGVRLAFTPTGGVQAQLSRKLVLRKRLG